MKWCTVNPDSGIKGDSDIIISVTQNNTETDRTAYVVLESGTVSDTIKVLQNAYSTYALYTKDINGVDLVTTPDDVYALITESPNNDYIVTLTVSIR